VQRTLCDKCSSQAGHRNNQERIVSKCCSFKCLGRLKAELLVSEAFSIRQVC
jgi:hypothetical protein